MKHVEPSAEFETLKIIEKIWRPLLVLAVVSAVGFGGYLGYSAYAESQEMAAQESLFELQKKTEKITKEMAEKAQTTLDVGNDKKKSSKMPEKNAAAKVAEAPKTPEEFATQYASVIGEYEAFIQKHLGKNAAVMAAVNYAGLASEYKDLARAEKVLQQVMGSTKESSLFFGLVRLHLGTVYMDQAKFNEAIATFGQIVNSKKQASFMPQALLRLGVCHMENNDFDKAVSTFTRLNADHPKSQAASEAIGLKRLATLKKGSST